MSGVVTCRPAAIPDVLILEPAVSGDRRGVFLESWRQERYAGLGIPADFVQDNVSQSVRGTLRGLHCQEPFGQGKLVQVLDGEVFDVAVDVRVGSPTFGQWVGVTLSSTNHQQLYIPQGFAHGFCVLSESAIFAYKCTEYYQPEAEFVVAWNDPDLAIAWPIGTAVLSPRDVRAPRLVSVPRERLPRYVAPTLAQAGSFE